MAYLYVSTDPKKSQAIIEPEILKDPRFLYSPGTLNSKFRYAILIWEMEKNYLKEWVSIL